jgi:hypothetical protein
MIGAKIPLDMAKPEKIRPRIIPDAPMLLAYSGMIGSMILNPSMDTAVATNRLAKAPFSNFDSSRIGFVDMGRSYNLPD